MYEEEEEEKDVFNMSDDEAKALSNYFAAVDGTEFPYQLIAERDAGYLKEKDSEFHKEFPDKKHDFPALRGHGSAQSRPDRVTD